MAQFAHFAQRCEEKSNDLGDRSSICDGWNGSNGSSSVISSLGGKPSLETVRFRGKHSIAPRRFTPGKQVTQGAL
jgi:hypothetical protein